MNDDPYKDEGEPRGGVGQFLAAIIAALVAIAFGTMVADIIRAAP